MNSPAPDLLAATQACRLAQGLSPDQQAVLASVLSLQHCAAGEVLAHEGSADSRLYAIVEGRLAVVKDLGGPEETTLVTLGAGDLAHELGFLEGAVRYASLRAAVAAQVLVLTREALESLIDTHPRVLYAVMRAILHSGRSVQTRLAVQAAELTNYVVKQHGRY